MKYTYYLLFILVLNMGVNFKLLAEEKRDQIKLTFANNVTIEIIGVDINKYPVDINFIESSVNRFFKYCEITNTKELLDQKPRSVKMELLRNNYYPAGEEEYKTGYYELSIEERELPNKIVSSNDFAENIYYLQNHELEFANDHFTYKLMFDEIDQLKIIYNEEAKRVIQEVMGKHLSNKSYFCEKEYYTVDKNYIYKKVYSKEHHANDEIILTGSTGLESVKNSWAINLELEMDLSFSRKGIRKNSYNIYYEWQYDLSNPNSRSLNQFVSLGYRRDFSNDPDKSNAYSFKLGYLAFKQGDLYKDNTYRISVRRRVHDHFYIEPHIYFNDFFKDAFPSIKIGLTF